MTRKSFLILFLILAVFAAALCSCGDDSSDSDSSGNDDDDTDDDAADDDAGDDDAGPPPFSRFRDLDLTLEFRNSARLLLWERDEGLLYAMFTAGEGLGNDLIPANTLLEGGGGILRFPESHFEIYTIHMTGPAIPEGPCGAEPVRLVLTLTGQQAASERIGGIAAYCGDETAGLPKRMLRVLTRFE